MRLHLHPSPLSPAPVPEAEGERHFRSQPSVLWAERWGEDCGLSAWVVGAGSIWLYAACTFDHFGPFAQFQFHKAAKSAAF